MNRHALPPASDRLTPVNVRLVGEGVTIPKQHELVYIGQQRDMHRWVVPCTKGELDLLDTGELSLRIYHLPVRVTLGVCLATEVDNLLPPAENRA